ncbi:MAG: hypothetical protein H6648_01750 [Caldilineae bacterium]|nr:hypothetical protein [Caldilineae bacterium]
MRTHKLLLTSALAVMLLGSAACSSGDDMSGSAVGTEGDSGVAPGDEPVAPEQPKEDPGIKGEEPAPGGEQPGGEQPGGTTSQGAQTLDEALALHKDSERLNVEIVTEDCGSTQCTEELQKLVEYIESGCGDGCPPVVENFVDNLTSAQKQSGIVPATFPTKRDLSGVADEAVEVAPAEPGDEAKGDEPADEPGAALDQAELDATVAAVVENLRASAGTDYEAVTWKEILAEIRQTVTDPEQALAMLAEIQSKLEDGFKSAIGDDTAAALLEGEAVAPADAADAIEAAWAAQP